MVAFEGSGRCGWVEAYYHDYLEDADSPSIPAPARDHIRGCQYCQCRVGDLRALVSGLDGGSGASARDWRLIGVLQRHFALLGERVTCSAVRALLPSLVDGSTPIRIPTPVTVHVDHCDACARDLECLRAGGEVAARADSGVVTVCTGREEGRLPAEWTELELYEDYPINVEVLGEERVAVEAGDDPAPDGGEGKRQRGLLSQRIRPFAKVAVVAAVLIPLAIMFTQTMPEATGLTAGEARDTMYRVPYVRVSRTYYPSNALSQAEELWIAPGKVLLWESTRTSILDDLERGETISFGNDPSGTASEDDLDPERRRFVELTIESILGFPADLVSPGKELTPMLRASATEPGVDVYRLAIASPEGIDQFGEEEWRVYIDAETGRFLRREYYRGASRTPYQREEYEYPDAATFQERIGLARSR